LTLQRGAFWQLLHDIETAHLSRAYRDVGERAAVVWGLGNGSIHSLSLHFENEKSASAYHSGLNQRPIGGSGDRAAFPFPALINSAIVGQGKDKLGLTALNPILVSALRSGAIRRGLG
jgi:hypothetical protein